MAINHAFFSPFKHFLFGRGVTDHKIRHLSGEFRRSFGPWGAGNLNEPIFEKVKGPGVGVGYPEGGILKLWNDRRLNFNQYKRLKPVPRIVKNIFSA